MVVAGAFAALAGGDILWRASAGRFGAIIITFSPWILIIASLLSGIYLFYLSANVASVPSSNSESKTSAQHAEPPKSSAEHAAAPDNTPASQSPRPPAPALAPKITPPVIQNNPPSQVLLDVTPDYLMDLYNDRFSVQADKLAEFYLGKLIHISGPLDNVSGPTTGDRDFKP